MEILIFMEIKQWRIQDSPVIPGVEGQPQRGNLLFGQSLPKTENEKIGPGGVSKILLRRSATVKHPPCQTFSFHRNNYGNISRSGQCLRLLFESHYF